jgi:hypothetical protein
VNRSFRIVALAIACALTAELVVTAQSAPTVLPRELFQVWIHSQEEDKNGVLVYRPRNFHFPPARGRDGFEVRQDGEFRLLSPGPADRSESIEGRWRRAGKAKIRVEFPTPQYNRDILILEATPELLRIKR